MGNLVEDPFALHLGSVAVKIVVAVAVPKCWGTFLHVNLQADRPFNCRADQSAQMQPLTAPAACHAHTVWMPQH